MQDIMAYSRMHELKPADAVNRLATQQDGDNQQLQLQMHQQGQQGQQQGVMNAPQQQMAGHPGAPNMMQQPNHAQMALQRNGIVQGMAAGSHTPNQNHMQLPPQGNGANLNFSSPATSNLNLPMHMNNGVGGMMNGSPHIGHHPGLLQQGMMGQGQHPGMNGPPGHMQHLQMMQMQNQHLQNHTPSPAQSHMAAPNMMAQLSQQGTNSGASNVNSANTSPQVNNKRRRSQVKMELDGMDSMDGMGPASQRIKPSPRMGGAGKKGK